MILKADINKVTLSNWLLLSGEFKARKITVELSDELLACSVCLLKVMLQDGSVIDSPIKDGTVEFPCILKPQQITIGVTAYNTDENGNLKERYSPEPCYYYVPIGSFKEPGKEQGYLSPGAYTEVFTTIENLAELIDNIPQPNYNQITVSLFDGTTEDNGLYLAGTGKWYESAQYYSIGAFAVEPGQKLYISAENIPSTGMQFTRWRDAECTNFVSGSVHTPTNNCIEFTNTAGAVQYIKIGVPSSVSRDTINVRYTSEIETYYELKKNINKSNVNGLETDLAEIKEDIGDLTASVENIGIGTQWQGKKWVAFGTSITATNNTGAPDGSCTGKYVPYLEELSGLSLTNRGVSGGRISGHILYYVHFYANEMANADLITIEGSVNDFAGGVPLGQVGDTVPFTRGDVQAQVDEYIASIGGSSEGTFAGACYQTFKIAQENAPDAMVVFITDNTGKNNVGYSNYTRGQVRSTTGLKQSDYINMAVAVAEYMGIPVIDAGRKSLVNEEHPNYLIDHIHHTELGGKQYANTIWAELKNIPNFIKS